MRKVCVVALLVSSCGFQSVRARDGRFDAEAADAPRTVDADESAGGVFPGCPEPLLMVLSEPLDGKCSTVMAGETDVESLRLAFTNAGEVPIAVRQIPLTYLHAAAAAAVRDLRVRREDGTFIPVSVASSVGDDRFVADLVLAEPITLAPGARQRLSFFEDLQTAELGAPSGVDVTPVLEPEITAPFERSPGIVAESVTDGCRIRLSRDDISFENPNPAGILFSGIQIIRHARLRAEIAPDTPSGLHSPSSGQLVAHFILRNDPNEASREVAVTDLRGGFATTIHLERGSPMIFYLDSLTPSNELFRVGFHPGPHGWEAGSFSLMSPFSIPAGGSRHVYVTVDTDDADARNTLTFELDTVSWNDGSGERGILDEVCGFPLVFPTLSY